MSCFFVTGTDTNVGKTVASRAIIQALQLKNIQIVGYKPIACTPTNEETLFSNRVTTDFSIEQENNPDVLTLLNSTNEKITYTEANSYSFQSSVPALSEDVHKIDIERIDQHLAYLNKTYQSVLVEGAFGWQSPITQEKTFADWVKCHNMPVVLVVGIKEGCINHALLTVQSIEQSNLPLLGWIANRINPYFEHYSELIALLTNKIDAPLLGKIPYIHKPETQELGKYITDLSRLQFMQTV